MSSSSDTLQFRFPTHGDSILTRINALREEHRFCDITLLLGGPGGNTAQPLHFHGHRVVLAASSDFLRDQFLLHKGRTELNVGVGSSVEVGKRLLLSCYTGLLEVPLRELVSYLTAASTLQMSQAVEKCAQAISQYLRPSLAFLELERHPEEKKIQLPDSKKNQEERCGAQSSSSIQKASTESKSKVSQAAEDNSPGLTEVTDERRAVIAEKDLSEDAACCLESEKAEKSQPVYTNNQSDQDQRITGALRCKPGLPTAVQDRMSSPTRGDSNQHDELVDASVNEDEEAQEEQREEEMFLLAAQLEKYKQLMDSSLCLLSGDELAEDPDSMLVQRPYLCRRCDRVFQHLESYMGHLKEHRQYLCLVCGKGFSQKSNLIRHVRVHTGVKPFRCPLCHKTFFQTATLQDHLNLHTGDKPHKCNYCAVHFAHKPGLRRHLKDIHGKSSLQNVLAEAAD